MKGDMGCDRHLADVLEHVVGEREDGLLQLLVVRNDRPAHQQASRVVVTLTLSGHLQVPNQPSANVAPGLCEAQGASACLHPHQLASVAKAAGSCAPCANQAACPQAAQQMHLE